MAYKIIEKKGIINSIKRKIIKKNVYEIFMTILHSPACHMHCGGCPFIDKDCSSFLRRRGLALKWLNKHGYKVDLSGSIKKIVLNKKYIFIGEEVFNYTKFMCKEDLFIYNYLNIFKKNNIKNIKISIEETESTAFVLTTSNEKTYILNIFFINSLIKKILVGEKDLKQNFFVFLKEDIVLIQEELDI